MEFSKKKIGVPAFPFPASVRAHNFWHRSWPRRSASRPSRRNHGEASLPSTSAIRDTHRSTNHRLPLHPYKVNPAPGHISSHSRSAARTSRWLVVTQKTLVRYLIKNEYFESHIQFKKMKNKNKTNKKGKRKQNRKEKKKKKRKN